MAFKVTRTYTLPENSEVGFFQQSVAYREWFEENWAGGGQHFSSETTISDDGRTMTKTSIFVSEEAFKKFAVEEQVRERAKERRRYNTANNITDTVTYEELDEEV